MRRRLIVSTALALSLSAAWLGWPFLAAYNIRHAARTGDTATLARTVDWPAVRASLKTSLAEVQANAAAGEAENRHGMPRPPSLWTRIKAVAAPAMIESFVERYATPEGVSQAMSLRDTWAQSVRPALGAEPPKTALASTMLDGSAIDRFWSFYARIRRAEFISPGLVEFEVADRRTPERRYVSRLALEALQWKLISVRVVGAGF